MSKNTLGNGRGGSVSNIRRVGTSHANSLRLTEVSQGKGGKKTSVILSQGWMRTMAKKWTANKSIGLI